ncbi:hypothetical protein HUW46_00579 [Amycolatopsis sp. CA-230715]|nr:hypothetical protein HUW46_00579 [Amycolatopsis sp. CA-230715]
MADIPLREAMLGFRDLVSADMAWIDSRKRRYRVPAYRTRIATLVLTASSTIVLA